MPNEPNIAYFCIVFGTPLHIPAPYTPHPPNLNPIKPGSPKDHPTPAPAQNTPNHSTNIGKSRENHRNNYWNLFGHLYGFFIIIIGLKVPGNYSAPFWSYHFSICLWEAQFSRISGFSNVSPSPKTNLFYLSRHRDTQQNLETPLGYF